MHLKTYQDVYIEYGFAIDEPEALPDGTSAKITMNKLLAHRHIVFDETMFTLGNERDVGGTRSGTYTNGSLNRGGARSTRSSQHVTGAPVTWEGLIPTGTHLIYIDLNRRESHTNRAKIRQLKKEIP